MNLTALRAELAKKKIHPVYLFSGEEDLLKEEALDELRRAVGGERAEVRKFQARETGATDILEAQRNATLFRPVGAVVVRDAAKLSESDGEALRAALGALAGGPPLVFWDASFDRRKALFADALKCGAEVEFRTPNRSEARGWVAAAAQRLGHRLASGVAERLVDLVGTDLRTLRSTLEKLSIAVGVAKPIGNEAVLKVVADSRSPALWELQDALSGRRGAPAVRLLRKALDEGEAPELLVGALFAEVRRLLLARELSPPVDPKRDGARIGAQPFKVAALIENSKRFPAAALRSAIVRLSLIDRKLKAGRADPAAALEAWILSVCEGHPRSA